MAKVFTRGQIQLATYGDPMGRRAVVRASDSGMSLGRIIQLDDGTFEVSLRFESHCPEIFATFDEACESVAKSQHEKPWAKYGELRAVEEDRAWLGAIIPIGGNIDFGSVYREGNEFFGTGNIPSGPFSSVEELLAAAWNRLQDDPLVKQRIAIN